MSGIANHLYATEIVMDENLNSHNNALFKYKVTHLLSLVAKIKGYLGRTNQDLSRTIKAKYDSLVSHTKKIMHSRL